MTSEFDRPAFDEFIAERSNWNRWGPDDQAGTLNLISAEKRKEAASLVRTGHSISLARPLPTSPAPNNPRPSLHFMERRTRRGYPTAGISADFIGVECHGVAVTHIDALCHIWDSRGMWNGRDPDTEIGFDGAKWGSIDVWKDGIVTRGVLLDIPRFRGAPYVELDEPVTGDELEAVAADQAVRITPGDAVVVYSGREAYSRARGTYGARDHLEDHPGARDERPGLHASCIRPLRMWDAAVLVWDMLDCTPSDVDVAFTVHASIFAFGMALVDNALLEPLATQCRANNRYEFMLCISPLNITGGTGSAVNPLAVL